LTGSVRHGLKRGPLFFSAPGAGAARRVLRRAVIFLISDAMNIYPQETQIICCNSDGLELRPSLVRLGRYSVLFELYGPGSGLRLSEALSNFQIIIRKRVVYSGRATIRNLVVSEHLEVCEVTLDESAWTDLELSTAMAGNGVLRKEFEVFIQDWQKLYRILPDYKIIIADMQSFLGDMRLWLEQVELQLRAAPEAQHGLLAENLIKELAGPLVDCVKVLFEKFEGVARTVDEATAPAHRNYMRRQLHSMVLAAPFAHRTFTKPLGYAGDYEMVGMIARNGFEGKSLFAKILHHAFCQQMPALAHRNRILHLKTRLLEETARCARHGQPARILNLGCGPALEVQQFLKESPLSDNARFTLLDFNDETLQYARTALTEIARQNGRRTEIALQKKSVMQMLKETARAKAADQQPYDLVYCAGLFDYLPDATCRHLMNIFHGLTAPGGLVLATNVEPSNPMRVGMEHLLDWNLIHRDAAQVRKLKPRLADEDDVSVFGDDTGVNVMLEIRKPAHA